VVDLAAVIQAKSVGLVITRATMLQHSGTLQGSFSTRETHGLELELTLVGVPYTCGDPFRSAKHSHSRKRNTECRLRKIEVAFGRRRGANAEKNV